MHKSFGLWLALAVQALAVHAATGETTASQVFATASPSIVVVTAVDSSGQPVAQGSGVVIAEDVVVSNCHVFADRNTATATVLYHDKRYPANLRFADIDHDLCSFTVNGLPAPPVQMRSASNLQVGENAYAIGAPEGYDLTLSNGIVSSLRKISGGIVIQTTAPISPGSSGGGLFDSAGRLIGITSYYAKNGQQINFALPAEWVEALPQRGKTLKQLSEQSPRIRGDYQQGVKASLNGDYATAIVIFQRLADKGDTRAEIHLGLMYGNGMGVAQDSVKMVYWIGKAANQGNAYAEWHLGSSYDMGDGVPQDDAKALYWYRKAANQGDAMAQYSVGKAYANGKAVPRDYMKAAYWYRKSAEQGGTDAMTAQRGLALLYYNGQGVPQDYVQAAKWMILFLTTAAEDVHGKALLATIENKMTPTQIGEAQKLARDWRAAHPEGRYRP